MDKKKYMIYNGESSNDIVNIPLKLCHFDVPNDLGGYEREIIKGETTSTRPIANVYGTKYSNNTPFDIGMIKTNDTLFNELEQRTINKWLTSNKTPRWLTFIDEEGNENKIRGIFTDIKWKIGSGGVFGANCAFEPDSPYVWEYCEHFINTMNTPNIIINVDSDELEEYIYPTFIVSNNENSDIAIMNRTDNENKMVFNANRDLHIKMDCRFCTIEDETNKDVMDFNDLHWSDVGNIYWLRLLPGENELVFTGDFDITLSYYVPQKKVGGWLAW